MKPSARNYLMVLPVETYPLKDGRFAVESAFAQELRSVRPLLGDRFADFVIVTPQMSESEYEMRKPYLAEMDPTVDQVRAVQTHPADVGKAAYLARYLPRVLRVLWQEISQAALVHAGPTHDVWRPYEIGALALGAARRRATISVTDMDLRSTPRMAYQTGEWSLQEYLKNQYVYEPIRDLQHHAVVRMCSLVLFKGQALCDDFGRGREHVKNIFDPAFPPELVATDEIVARKLATLRDPQQPLRLLYFGRYVSYKGVDRMLDALKLALPRANGRLRFRLIGMGPEEAALRAQVDRDGLTDHVEFSDPVPYGPAFFERLYTEHLMLAMPLSEDTPRSTWDALAAGVPILGFDTHYYHSLAVNTEAVELVPWPSVEAFAERLVHHANDRSQLEQWSWNAVRAARENTQLAWLERRLGWIDEALAAR